MASTRDDLIRWMAEHRHGKNEYHLRFGGGTLVIDDVEAWLDDEENASRVTRDIYNQLCCLPTRSKTAYSSLHKMKDSKDGANEFVENVEETVEEERIQFMEIVKKAVDGLRKTLLK